MFNGMFKSFKEKDLTSQEKTLQIHGWERYGYSHEISPNWSGWVLTGH